MKPDKPTQDENQGEGDRTSARRYARHVREFVATGQVEPAARSADDYVERHPEAAARAEREARRGPRTRVSLDELIAKGRTLVDRVESAARRIADRIRRS